MNRQANTFGLVSLKTLKCDSFTPGINILVKKKIKNSTQVDSAKYRCKWGLKCFHPIPETTYVGYHFEQLSFYEMHCISVHVLH